MFERKLESPQEVIIDAIDKELIRYQEAKFEKVIQQIKEGMEAPALRFHRVRY